jgi:hypothetical protein
MTGVLKGLMMTDAPKPPSAADKLRALVEKKKAGAFDPGTAKPAKGAAPKGFQADVKKPPLPGKARGR